MHRSEQGNSGERYGDDDYGRQKTVVRNAMRGIQPESVRTKRVPTHYGSVFSDEVERFFGLGDEERPKRSAS